MKICTLVLCGLVYLNSLPVFADTEEVYRFERMWPILQQPWHFNEPLDIAVNNDGEVYVADTGNNVVKRFTEGGHLINQWQWKLDLDTLVVPKRVALDSNDNVYVLYRQEYSDDNSGDNLIRVFNSQGNLITKNQWQEPDRNIGNSGLAIDSQDNVYVTNHVTRVIQKFTNDGQSLGEWPIELFEGDLPEGNLRIAISSNFVYVADEGGNRIRKYTYDGQLEKYWGSKGSKEGEFDSPESIAIDSQDYIYVTDKKNNRIQKFNSEGKFISQWRDEREQDLANWQEKTKNFPLRKAIELVTHPLIGDIIRKIFISGDFKVFDKYFEYLSLFIWQGDDNEVFQPKGIAVDSQDNVYVTYNFPKNSVQKYTPKCLYIDEETKECPTINQKYTKWTGSGAEKGQFYIPVDIARDKNDNIYITDAQNHRVSKFSADGQFITQWGELGSNSKQFIFPSGIAIGIEKENTYVYVVDTGNARIQKFDDEGTFITEWGHTYKPIEYLLNENLISLTKLVNNKDELQKLINQEDNNGFIGITGIAVDNDNHVYVVDSLLRKVKKFTSDGQFISEFGSKSGFNVPVGIATDSENNVYVVDYYNHNVKKFDPDGKLLTQWSGDGTNDGQFREPNFVTTVTDNGKIYVYITDSENRRIQKFDADGNFITKWGESGIYPGQFSQAGGLTVSTDGKVYVTDLMNNRIQVFNRTRYTSGKAVIVAGGGPYAGNDLWDDTQMVANFAYRSLVYQGFTKDTIYYLSAAKELDLDNNGEADDVDAEPTETNLETAITTWASDVDNLTIFLTNHGGDKVFTLQGEVDILKADKLNGWLNSWQNKTQGNIKIIYDACYSGSFVQLLKAENRIIITSAATNERAYFDDKGSLSFSNYFWTHVFNGLDMEESFNQAAGAVNYMHHVETVQKQTPWLEANGDGCVNKGADFQQVKDVFIGNGTYIHKDAPLIEAVSPAQTLIDTNSAVIYAEVDNDNIARAWAIIRSPVEIQRHVQSSGVIGQPILQLPSFELEFIEGTNRYEGSYDKFEIEGRYEVAIYVRDRDNNTSVPKTTTVFVKNPYERKAVIIVGELPIEAQSNTKDAYETLKYQGYKDDNIYYIGNSSIPGIGAKLVLATLDNVEFAITTWAKDNTQNIVIYIEGLGNEAEFMLNDSEVLPFKDFKVWLDGLQSQIPGAATVIYEGPFSGYLLPALGKAPEDKPRIVITSTGTNEIEKSPNAFTFSFSKFFWQKVYNGANTRNAFRYAKSAIIIAFKEQQIPQLDANSNGIGNEGDDKRIANEHSIGMGVVSATEPSVDKVQETLSCLIPSQMEYHHGDRIQVEPLPLPTTDYDHYFAVGLPDGHLFAIQRLNDVIPFESVETLPIWANTHKMVIDMTLDANILPGGYRFYSVTLPKETPIKLPLDPKTFCSTCVWVEE
jgi:sugar lactone lactonase YvrE